ncbi:hypothetical protein AKJ44_00695 [candidate division MSBL1 archaeon SCGC-AAA261F17]|uniref:MoaB/Mog domain-containing protein n=1 Tax=candidate division MSBL1 archaeon SCGC-AAA261F17 TaxID=1698274 RepID=A0A133V7C2_9EURY|nr:hypothetical protein AKJ44_00695 [candidate division MSBL1 archaeon SCGC-AAA261F17]
MKRVRVEDSIGKPLAHDVIQYGPEVKRVLFKRGHLISSEDLDKLKNAGNYYVYISEEENDRCIHEEEAALRIARASAGENISITEPSKGRVRLLSETPGLLKVKPDIVGQVNLEDGFVFATRLNNSGVRKSQEVASTKIVPLVIEEEKLEQVEKILEDNKPVIEVIPPKIEKIGVIIAGKEVYEERIEDAFKPVLEEKLKPYGLTITKSIILPDDEEKIKEKIIEYKNGGLELILVTGGMAVDAGDVTANAIRGTGARVIPRGTPIFPGNMAMVAYLEDVPVLGLPACVIPDPQTSFDFLLPRVLAKEEITNEDIAELGHGGLL